MAVFEQNMPRSSAHLLFFDPNILYFIHKMGNFPLPMGYFDDRCSAYLIAVQLGLTGRTERRSRVEFVVP
jgi:hypothetical protein